MIDRRGQPQLRRAFVGALRDRWRLIAFVTIVALATAVVSLAIAPSEYQAISRILVSPLPPDDPTFTGIQVLRETGDPTRSVVTLGLLVKTSAVVKRVTQRLGGDQDELLGAVEVRPVGDSDLLAILARDQDATQAADIADAFAEAFIVERTHHFRTDVRKTIAGIRDRMVRLPSSRSEAHALEARLALLTPLLQDQDPTLAVAGEADVPRAPIYPRPALTIVIVIFTTPLLTAILISCVQSLRRVVKTP